MLHREGKTIIPVSTILYISILTGLYYLNFYAFIIGLILFTIVYGLIINFFRNPKRETISQTLDVLAPVDGKVVVIEEVYEPEFFKDKRLQISVFMSPLNVHVCRYPVEGNVIFDKYHPGKFLVAWHPKSSTENERTTVVVEHTKTQKQVLFRQIAGALARRIVLYAKKGDTASKGGEYGFIKFGSRVDVYLPIGTKVLVELNQKTLGGVTKIAELVE